MVYKCSIPHEYRCPHTIATMRPWFCSKCSQQDAEGRYTAMNNAYRAGQDLCKDMDWDRYEKYCRERHPDCTTFHKVGVI